MNKNILKLVSIMALMSHMLYIGATQNSYQLQKSELESELAQWQDTIKDKKILKNMNTMMVLKGIGFCILSLACGCGAAIAARALLPVEASEMNRTVRGACLAYGSVGAILCAIVCEEIGIERIMNGWNYTEHLTRTIDDLNKKNQK